MSNLEVVFKVDRVIVQTGDDSPDHTLCGSIAPQDELFQLTGLWQQDARQDVRRQGC